MDIHRTQLRSVPLNVHGVRGGRLLRPAGAGGGGLLLLALCRLLRLRVHRDAAAHHGSRRRPRRRRQRSRSLPRVVVDRRRLRRGRPRRSGHGRRRRNAGHVRGRVLRRRAARLVRRRVLAHKVFLVPNFEMFNGFRRRYSTSFFFYEFLPCAGILQR
jgi:hypothetical protein